MPSRRLFLKGSALAMFGVGSMPVWLSRSLYAADSTEGRKKILVAIFQRGAVDGLNMVIPFAEPRYYALRPSIAIPKPDGTPELGPRPGWILRTASGARAAEADVRRAASGDRRRRGLARSHTLAFRRAGLHGVRYARLS